MRVTPLLYTVPPLFAYCSTIHFVYTFLCLPQSKLPGVTLCIPSIQHPAIQAIFCHINDYAVHTENFISISQTLDKIPYFLSNHQRNAGVNLVCPFSLHLDSMFEPRFSSIDRHRDNKTKKKDSYITPYILDFFLLPNHKITSYHMS